MIFNTITPEDQALLDDVFTYHPPVGDQQERYVALREHAKAFATAIMAIVPPCADRTVALRKVREAVMDGNAAIALGGKGLR